MEAETHLAIETEGLTKAFGDTRAVDGVDLAVRCGAGSASPASSRPWTRS